jgi:hypothetical protein
MSWSVTSRLKKPEQKFGVSSAKNLRSEAMLTRNTRAPEEALAELLVKMQDAREELVAASTEQQRVPTLQETVRQKKDQFRREHGEERAFEVTEIPEYIETQRINGRVKIALQTIQTLRSQLDSILRQLSIRSRQAEITLTNLSQLIAYPSLEQAETIIGMIEVLLGEISKKPHANRHTNAAREAKPSRGQDATNPARMMAGVDPEESVKNNSSVPYEIAARYLNVSRGHIGRLVLQRKLDSVGRGQNKKITSQSLQKYRGETPPPKKSEPK